jgi:thiol-disulfide isomerase/thioredoxin
LALLFSACGTVGREAPDFSLRGAYGGTIDKDSFRGRPVMLMFWTTSCGVCRNELPVADRMAREFGRDGVEVVAVNIGDTQGAREVLRTMRLTNAIDENGEAARRYRVRGVPKFVLIDRHGKLKREATGFQRERVLRSWLQSVAAGE